MFTGKKKAACAAMLCMAMTMPFASLAENETRVITCGTLNLRAEESASSKILGKYGWGSEVLVKGVNGDWASVDVGGQSGYMYAKYLGREGTTNSTAYVKTNSRGLNLRAEPNGNILGSYPRGTKVTVLATTGEWSKVSVDGKTGYMQSRWLSGKAVSGGSSAVSPAAGTAVVNNPRDTQVLFLRREANVSSESLGYYRNGKTVTLLARQGDWYKVSVDGKTGYMMAKYLKVTADMHNGTARVFNANGGSCQFPQPREPLRERDRHGSGRHDGQGAGKDDRLDEGRGKRQDRLYLHLVPQILIPALLPQKALAQSGRRFFHRIDGFFPQAAANSAFHGEGCVIRRINFPALLKLRQKRIGRHPL